MYIAGIKEQIRLIVKYQILLFECSAIFIVLFQNKISGYSLITISTISKQLLCYFELVYSIINYTDLEV